MRNCAHAYTQERHTHSTPHVLRSVVAVLSSHTSAGISWVLPDPSLVALLSKVYGVLVGSTSGGCPYAGLEGSL